MNNKDLGVRYFSIEDYVNNIKVSDKVIDHLLYVEEEFIEYIKKLFSYNVDYITKYWIYLLYDELKSTNRIENLHLINFREINSDLLSNNCTITHKRIHQLHDFAVAGDNKDGCKYRDVPVNVSSFDKNGNEQIYYRAVNNQDVNKFMDDFVKVYNYTANSTINDSSFLKSALLHLLFVKIHPYLDGNGRTARIIHNLKFTSSLGKYHGISLKLSPINLSRSLNLNKITYFNQLNLVKFDGITDDNDAINRWFEFILNMCEEQIYMCSERLDRIDRDFISRMDNLQQQLNGVNPKDTGIKALKKYYTK